MRPPRPKSVIKNKGKEKPPKVKEAASSSLTPSPPTLEEATERAHWLLMMWQVLLGLSDWIISIEFVTPIKLDDPWCYARSFIDPHHSQGKIELLHPHYWDGMPNLSTYGEIAAFNLESALVHELVHVILHPITKELDKDNQWIEEQAINQITRALLSGSKE